MTNPTPTHQLPTHPWDDLYSTQDEHDNCPAIWNGQCDANDCPAADEIPGYTCAQEPLITPAEAVACLARIFERRVPECINHCKYEACDAFWYEGSEAGCSHIPESTQVLKCDNCGLWYGEYGSGCPDCNFPDPIASGIEEALCTVIEKWHVRCDPHNCGVPQVECPRSLYPRGR